MRNAVDRWEEALRAGRVLARFQVLIFRRMVAYHVRHTLAGKFGALSILAMCAILAVIASRGFLETLPSTEAGLDGLLLATHLWLAVSLSLMLLCQFAKAFIRRREDEPLVAHPGLFPALARHRVLASIPFVSFTFIVLFFVYFWQLLAARLSGFLLPISIHLLTTGVLVVVGAAVIGDAGRRLLRAALMRGIRNADLLVNAIGVISLLAFGALLLVIILTNEYAVSALEAVGGSVAVSIPLGMIPFAAALAADEGRWLATIAWLGLSAALAMWAVRATYRWSFTAFRELPVDLASPAKRMFAPLFTGSRARWLPAGVIAMWRKDIIIPYSREPKRYLFHQVNLIWWGIMVTVLAMALRDRENISAAFADTMPVLITLIAMAVIAMQNGINALGREGTALSWLRTVFSGRQLLSSKLVVNVAYVLVHGLAYALVVSLASRAAFLGTSFPTLVAYAVCSGFGFACYATAIGFLLPDFERMRSSLPGSTAIGKAGFLLGALLLIAMTGTAHLFLASGVFDGITFVGMLFFESICAAVCVAVLATAALRQYRGIEI